MRGVWLTNVGTAALDSRANIRQMVKACNDSHINTIFMVVWNSGFTLFPSMIMYEMFDVAIWPKFAGRDPL